MVRQIEDLFFFFRATFVFPICDHAVEDFILFNCWHLVRSSDRTLKYCFGVTAHARSTHSCPSSLRAKRFKGRHTEEKIAALDEIWEECNTSDKIDFIIADNACNMKNAFKVMKAEDSGEMRGRCGRFGSMWYGLWLSPRIPTMPVLFPSSVSREWWISKKWRGSPRSFPVSKLATRLHRSTILRYTFASVFGAVKSILWPIKQVQDFTELDSTALTEIYSVD